MLPLEGQGSVSGINLPAHQLSPQEAPIANYRAVSSDYFQTMGIPVLAGRARHRLDLYQHLTTPQFVDTERVSHRKKAARRVMGETEAKVKIHLLPGRDSVCCAKVRDLF
jgi:hypothetical protein